jgi:hypothetical protein
VALNYKKTNFAKNSITPAIQPISSITAKAKFHSQTIVFFPADLYLTPNRKEAGHE